MALVLNNDACSVCFNYSEKVEIVTLDTCNHVICGRCFAELMGEGTHFSCPCDTKKSNNVIISRKTHELQTAMSYCNYKSIICDHSLDDYVSNCILDECFNVMIRMKSLKDFRDVKYDFFKELGALFELKYPVDTSVLQVLKAYEKKIFMKMEPTFYCEDTHEMISKIRKILYNLRCECNFTDSPCIDEKLKQIAKLTEFFHNIHLDYLFMQLNPYHLTRRYSYTRFYGLNFFKNYFERYEEDIVQFQKVMHFPTVLLLSQSTSNGEHYRKLYPFMFKHSDHKCLVCIKDVGDHSFGTVEECSHIICDTCITKYLITKVRCPIDGCQLSPILMAESHMTSLEHLKSQPDLFDDVFTKLDEIIFGLVKHIHNIIPKAEIIWMNVTQLFDIADHIHRPKLIHNSHDVTYGRKVQDLLSVIETICYSTINDESFFQPSSFNMYYSSFCKTSMDVSYNNDGYLTDPSKYQRMEETIHLYVYLHHFAISIYNHFVSDIEATFQHFEKTDKILIDLKEHFNIDRPNHISIRKLKKDMPILLSQHKYIDALRSIKLSLKKTKCLNHLCKNMMWY